MPRTPTGEPAKERTRALVIEQHELTKAIVQLAALIRRSA
jgi:hypothetical protein